MVGQKSPREEKKEIDRGETAYEREQPEGVLGRADRDRQNLLCEEKTNGCPLVEVELPGQDLGCAGR